MYANTTVVDYIGRVFYDALKKSNRTQHVSWGSTNS